MGSHTWVTGSPSPPVLNSHPEAWLGVSLRDRFWGQWHCKSAPSAPAGSPLSVSQPKLVASSMPFWGKPCRPLPLGGLGICGLMNVLVTTWGTEGGAWTGEEGQLAGEGQGSPLPPLPRRPASDTPGPGHPSRRPGRFKKFGKQEAHTAQKKAEAWVGKKNKPKKKILHQR